MLPEWENAFMHLTYVHIYHVLAKTA